MKLTIPFCRKALAFFVMFESSLVKMTLSIVSLHLVKLMLVEKLSLDEPWTLDEESAGDLAKKASQLYVNYYLEGTQTEVECTCSAMQCALQLHWSLCSVAAV